MTTNSNAHGSLAHVMRDDVAVLLADARARRDDALNARAVANADGDVLAARARWVDYMYAVGRVDALTEIGSLLRR